MEEEGEEERKGGRVVKHDRLSIAVVMWASLHARYGHDTQLVKNSLK